jgi:Flp pilus assembly protein protease CpaA
MTIKVVHEAFGFLALGMMSAFAAGFLAIVGLLFWRERECAAAAEMGRDEVHAGRRSRR